MTASRKCGAAAQQGDEPVEALELKISYHDLGVVNVRFAGYRSCCADSAKVAMDFLRRRLPLLVLVAPLLPGSWASAAEPEVEMREQVLAQALRSVVTRSCSPDGIPCCLAVPDGWVSESFMNRLSGLPVRKNEADPLLGECPGNLVSVRQLEWVTEDSARVQITVGTELAGDRCTVSVERRSGAWTASKTECEFI
jgi:hypothetical protein